jgi:hypothetical protein
MRPLNSANLWHSKLWSINKHKLQQIQKNIYGIFLFDESSLSFCEPCVIGKHDRLIFLKWMHIKQTSFRLNS